MKLQSQSFKSLAAINLLWIVSFVAAQTSSILDPFTGEPIALLKGSDFRKRRQLAATCPEAVDVTGESYFHPTQDTDAGALCTNSNDYPQVWKQIPLANNIPQYISDTGEECCRKFYARHGVPLDTCMIDDVCAEKPVYWHVSKYNPTTCTNSGDYPKAWDQPSLARYHLFSTPQKCCQDVKTKTGQNCDFRDVFEPWTCNKWHLSIETDDEGNPIDPDGTCTNSGVIHEVWLAYDDHYVFPSFQACCNKFQMSAQECNKVDMCAPPPTPPPTLPPTMPPTRPPTMPPTQPPSLPPTPKPTRAPEPTNCPAASVSENGPFHRDIYGELACTNTKDYPPAWENIVDANGKHEFLFDTMEDCVSHFQPFIVTGVEVLTVNVCASDCCSYSEENGLRKEQCQGGCTTTTTTTPAPEACEDYSFSKYFHPAIYMGDSVLCTNSPNYPVAWRNMQAEPKFLHSSGEDCCRDYYGSFGIPADSCEIEDLCPASKSVSVASEDLVVTTDPPTPLPSKNPTPPPSKNPTKFPTPPPTPLPSNPPSKNPTNLPTPLPSNPPSKNPTNLPTPLPSKNPTNKPTTREPTHAPSDPPFTNKPTDLPTPLPSSAPSHNPTKLPTPLPSNSPTKQPTPMPSNTPSKNPTKLPTPLPSNNPTQLPTKLPTPLPSSLPTSKPTDVTRSNDAVWYPATIDGEPTCTYGAGYPPAYADYGWLYEDDVDENGQVSRSGEQKCCEAYELECRLKFVVKDDMWYPVILNGERACDYGNEYPSSYSVANQMLFDSEAACCTKFGLSHCIPKEPKWYPHLADDGTKSCAYDVPPSELSSAILFDSRDDCCAMFPEACPTTSQPTTAMPRPVIETPPCEATGGKECAWWPDVINFDGNTYLVCQYSSTWPNLAADTLTPDNDGNGYYECCDKYMCSKNADGSFVDVKDVSAPPTPSLSKSPTKQPSNVPSHSPTKLPTPLPSNSPSRSPTNAPSHAPSNAPSKNPTNLPTPLPSKNPTSKPTTREPTHSPSDPPFTNKPTDLPTPLPSNSPTRSPTEVPTPLPSNAPSRSPTNAPSHAPSNAPSENPTKLPTPLPSKNPTNKPTTREPTHSPSDPPFTSKPTKIPTPAPSNNPTTNPTEVPTPLPSNSPSKQPTPMPSNTPSKNPTKLPTPLPSNNPTQLPTKLPTPLPSSLPTSNPTNEDMWYPATINGEQTCTYGANYDSTYVDSSWLFEDDVDENGRSGEQKCCEAFELVCRLKFVVKDDMWYPVILNGERACDYGNEYPSSYSVANQMLFDSEAACCTKFDLPHCIPKEPKWYPHLADDGTKSCAYDVPPSELSSAILFDSRDDCCAMFPEACPTTSQPTTAMPRPVIETPPCEATGGKECAWWPDVITFEDELYLVCQYSSTWPNLAADTLTPDNDGNGYYECCDKYMCSKNADGSYVDVKDVSAPPTPSPSKSPTQQPSRSPTSAPSHAPSNAPSGQPTPLPSQSPSKSPTSQPVEITTTVAATTTTSDVLVTHSTGLCGDWHISREVAMTCTNSGIGTEDPPADCVGWFKSGEECCLGYFGTEDCDKIDVTATTTQATTTTTTTSTTTTTTTTTSTTSSTTSSTTAVPVSCGNWHVSLEVPLACTNSRVGMAEPDSSCNKWYETGEECCVSYFGRECSMIDVLGETTTKPTPISHCDEWHIDEKNPDVCTNSEDYPKFWKNDFYSKFFFSTSQACCEQVSGCKTVDVCALCTEEYLPVCGSDNLTYENKCKAGAAGIMVFTEGACDFETTSTTSSSVTPATTTTSSTTSSTTTSTTSSNPGDMEQNSDSINLDNTCSQHKKKRRCKYSGEGCVWDKKSYTCRHESEEPMEETASDAVCSKLYKKRSRCQKEGCVWTRAKSRKDRCNAPDE